MRFKAFLSIVLFFFVLSVVNPSHSLAAEKNLSVQNYSQEKSNWCWVAASQIVARYLTGSYTSQCTFYKAGKQVSTCSGNLAGSFYSDVARALEKEGVYTGTVGYTLPPMYMITDEINGGSPLLSRIGWKSTDLETGHMLIIYGYNTSGSYVRYVYPKQSTYATDKTSQYRISTHSYLEENSSWKLTHTRYNLD
ncbi:papain-like cysteine protease family protein [Niallia sp. 03133]|uniref:papain-like cysteine protease family protein n=1 Tax=Niallia sp. 03133 TaxID=3458060 RepID=UPI004043D08A